jgi:hypothetical protein
VSANKRSLYDPVKVKPHGHAISLHDRIFNLEIKIRHRLAPRHNHFRQRARVEKLLLPMKSYEDRMREHGRDRVQIARVPHFDILARHGIHRLAFGRSILSDLTLRLGRRYCSTGLPSGLCRSICWLSWGRWLRRILCHHQRLREHCQRKNCRCQFHKFHFLKSSSNQLRIS